MYIVYHYCDKDNEHRLQLVKFFKKEYFIVLVMSKVILVMRFTNVCRFADSKANFFMNFLSVATLRPRI